MNKLQVKKEKVRCTRAMRVRKKLRGTATRPRLCVVKSNKHIEVQLIDDEQGHTIGSTSTFSREFKTSEFNRKNKQSAAKLGERIASIALENNIQSVIFDRGSHKYHGTLAELANAARNAGLQF